MRTTKPHVKKWKWGSAETKWVVDGLRDENGRRRRKFFRSRDEANEWLAQRRPEILNQGRAALGMTDQQRMDAVRALAILAKHGVTLTTAAESFVERAELLERTVTFSVLRKEILEAKTADGKSAYYLADLKNRLKRVGLTFDDRQVASIEVRELDDWLRGLGMSPTSRVNFRKVLHTAFEFAVSRGYSRTNPVAKTAVVKAGEMVPGILTPREMAAFLSAADVKIVPAIAIAGFAGLRDAEIGRITWDCIDLVGGYIKVGAAIAKTSSRRLVPISANLRAWLTPFAKKIGPIKPTPRVSYPLYCAARKAAAAKLVAAGESGKGLEEWPFNALRHSFASYRMALIGNAAQVAEESGNSVTIMKRHYRELVTRAEAENWFGIAPEEAAPNVVEFVQAANG